MSADVEVFMTSELNGTVRERSEPVVSIKEKSWYAPVRARTQTHARLVYIHDAPAPAVGIIFVVTKSRAAR